ncbi:family 1 glycosylhydrolase [Nakamurella aerolata]|uniref:Family 1 glycosylhydrolase n=1 Tax=Nakamurella aerolata TaxID=1656892 RepID=A0A849AC89_9ACTN|nr:family 1 glycosylhydrolase [Nakamurella aerolata]
MTGHLPGFPRDRLRWLVGIEDTCVYPPPGSTMGELNEFALTEHDTHWRADLAAAAALGATGLRYGAGWPLVHVAPGRFDWSQLDERIDYAVGDLGLTVIADLVHYGTPTWLRGSFADSGFPDALADFSAAFAQRYRGIVDHITPLNEPLTTASFCGLRGVWPPELTGWTGWSTVVIGIARGVQRSIASIRRANPDATIVHVEASAIYDTTDNGLRSEVELLRSLAALPTELILGRVGGHHPLRNWLLKHDVSTRQLAELEHAAAAVDLLGVNYYPDLTPRVLERRDGVVRQVTANHWSDGLRDVLADWHKRYGLPLLITETSIEGSDRTRREWLQAAVTTVRDLQAGGLDVRGLTWWPLLDFVDWSFASGGRNVEEFVLDPATAAAATAETFAEKGNGLTPFLRRMGLIGLSEEADGALRRTVTDAAGVFPREIETITMEGDG